MTFFIPIFVIWDIETCSSNFLIFTSKKLLNFLLLTFKIILNISNDITFKSSFLLRNFDSTEFEILHFLSSLLRNDKTSIFSDKSFFGHIRVLIDGEFNAFIIFQSIMLSNKFIVFSENLEPFLELRFRQVGFPILSNEFQVCFKRVRGVS